MCIYSLTFNHLEKVPVFTLFVIHKDDLDKSYLDIAFILRSYKKITWSLSYSI